MEIDLIILQLVLFLVLGRLLYLDHRARREERQLKKEMRDQQEKIALERRSLMRLVERRRKNEMK